GRATPAAAAAAATAAAPVAATVTAAPSDDNLARLLAQLQAMVPPAPRLHMIRAAVGNSVRMIALADVVYFEALDKYINVVCQDSEALIRTSLKELLPQLDPQQFWQIHRGTIVNASAIATAVRDEAGKLSLTLRQHPAQLRVSPLYAHLFRQM
ncbi:LytTR family DNA-binding domain-containing protein, partial [Janthinobacterium sp. HH106]|uniref:LytR/AlgR family response regulator transcription factor n=1 Tax=Janthinobacterium sp. HH106 TaxID=1537278 RepID=UPI000B2D9093